MNYREQIQFSATLVKHPRMASSNIFCVKFHVFPFQNEIFCDHQRFFPFFRFSLINFPFPLSFKMSEQNVGNECVCFAKTIYISFKANTFFPYKQITSRVWWGRNSMIFFLFFKQFTISKTTTTRRVGVKFISIFLLLFIVYRATEAYKMNFFSSS